MRDSLRNIAARGVWTEHHQHIGEAFGEHAEIGARGFSPSVFEPAAVLAADIDPVKGPSYAVEASGVDQDVEFVFLLCGFDALAG